MATESKDKTDERFEPVVRRLLRTPPQQHKPKDGKKKRSPHEQRAPK